MTSLSTPSKHRIAARSLSHNTDIAVSEFKEDLAVDVSKAQTCDLDDLIKYKLSSILKQDSEGKEDLDGCQKRIEELERKIDTRTRKNLAAEQEKQRAHNAMDQTEDRPTLIDPEVVRWEAELKEVKLNRQNILDRLFDICLKKVLPICEDDTLRGHLTKYSNTQSEVDLYAPFVNGCNRALDLMDDIDGDMFRPTSSLNCRFHRSDPMPIKTSYDGSSINNKPDVIITSTVAAQDLHHYSGDPSGPPKYDQPPKKGFQMRQTLCCSEFKKVSRKSLTLPLKDYGEKRQSKYACKIDLSETTGNTPVTSMLSSGSKHGLDESGPAVEAEEPPTKRTKMSTSKGSKTGVIQRGPRSITQAITQVPNKSQNTMDAETQCAMYGMEMLSYAIGVHHAITLLFIDCKLWVWYYDRQGIIQSDGIDFVKDLPRFLVLLFAFQRFDLTDWGVITELNPGAELAHNGTPHATNPNTRTRTARASDDARLEREKEPQTCTLKTTSLDADSLGGQCLENLNEIKINLGDWLSHKPHSLAGRATAVNGASDPKDDTQGKLACKLSFPEVARECEGILINDLRREIEEQSKMPHLSKHLPQVLFYGDMSRYGTQRVRSMVCISIRGYRTLRILVSRKLAPLTSLVGEEFVKAWLEVVRFHAFLWSLKTEHGDPSLWNVMYDEDLKCGVLGDYDLSISRRHPRVPGTDRTGTIPFMSVDLLKHEYWLGEIERLYRHELEAFIWILPFVFLRYQDGKAQRGTPVDPWMTSNYITCLEKKTFFWTDTVTISERLCQSDFKDLWFLAEHLLIWCSVLVNGLKHANLRQNRGKANPSEHDYSLVSLWPLFVEQLRLAASYSSLEIGFIDKLIDDLELERPFW